jgi:hypothetical protein
MPRIKSKVKNKKSITVSSPEVEIDSTTPCDRKADYIPVSTLGPVEFLKSEWYYDNDIQQEFLRLMTDWQITAKTIYCDAVDDEVTLHGIQRHFLFTAPGCKKYNEPDDITRSTIKEKGRKLRRPVKCECEQCSRVIQYKERILAEETK